MREEMQDNPSLNDQDVQQDLQPNQKEKSSENKSLSRRRLLKNTTAAGAATLAVGGGFALAKSSILLTPAQASSDPNTFNLPLNI